ncbi:MAG: DUF2752 domain-containing protein [Mucilaginibacter sp.]
MKTKIVHIALAVTGIMAICAVYYFFDPERYSLFPKCPFHALTGLDCPGCGSQRAVHALLHADISKAIGYNLLLVMSLPLLITHAGYKTASVIKNTNIQLPLLYHRGTPKVIFVIVAVFWIVRNTPVYPFDI